MANEIRARFNLVSGTLSSSLTNVATSMSSAGLANLGVIDTTNYAAVTIENEIVWVTAHTGGATTATILRAQEGTSAAAHGTVAWQHGSTAFDLGTDWTTYTPTLTQSATVTKTLTYSKYVKIGRLVIVQVDLAITGTGTANNEVILGLPVTEATGCLKMGTGLIYDSSAGLIYTGFTEHGGSGTVRLRSTNSTANLFLGGSGAPFTAALASGDIIRAAVTYESLA